MTPNLPLINACLNSLSAVFLVLGFLAIHKQKNVKKHKKLMISAFCTSALFLTCYLYYHFTDGHFKFTGEGTVRIIYFIILVPHILLAAIMVPFILITFNYGFKAEPEAGKDAAMVEKYRLKHLKMARITLPMWLYVSLTGVILYLYIYVWFPGKLKPKAEKTANQIQTELSQ